MAQPFEKALVDEGIAGTSLEGLARSIYSQESGGGKNTKTSNAGAVGGMQVIPSTFKSVNPQGDINNPYDNAVAGLRYIKQLHGQSGGDFGLTAAGYYGGSGAMSKAQKGVAVSDPRNPNAPNTLQYSKQVTDRMGKSGATQTKAANPEIQSSIADLGPNYQAAYALMSAPSTDDEDLDNYEKAQQVVAEKEADDTPADFSKAKEMLASVKFESPFASSPAPQDFSEGGEAVKAGLPETESASMLDKLKKTAGEVVRSAQYAPYDIVGTPVDLVNLGLKGVDYVTGSKLSSEAPVGGSEYLINKANQMGIADKPTGSITEDLTRMGLGLLSPTAGPRAMVAAGKAVKGTAKAALEDLALASTGQGGSRVAQGAAKALNLEPSFAVAPNSSVSRSMLDEIDPAIQRLLDKPPAKRFVGPKLPERELTSPTGERPFVSTLDKFFEQNNNPVTVEQLVNQLSKSSRDYEMNRLVKLLEGKAPTDKVRPSDLLEQLKETSPARFRMEIKEPDSKNMGQFFASMENPFPSKPMGTVNLLEDLSSKEKLAARYTSDLYDKDMLYYKTTNPLFTERDRSKALENLELFFSGPMAKQSAGSDLTSSFKRDVPDIRRLSKKIKEMQMDMSDISFLYKVDRYGFDYSKEHNAIISSVIAKHSEFDKLPIDEKITKLNEIIDPIITRDAENHFLSALDKKYGTDMLSHRQALGTSWDSMSGYEKSKVTERMLGDVIGGDLTTAKENLRNLEKPYVDAIEKAHIQARPYSGQHSSIANENPISFSRFQDITLPTKENVMVIPELQSDRFQSILESGSKGGSQYKDRDELGDLNQKLDSITQKIYSAATPQLRDQLKLEGKKIENRISKLNERIATGKYNTSEFIPGIEEMPQVMQQLMVKNAISAGIQRGKNGIIFPGPDSAQAQLYEKLPNNLRAVVKDLGKGFEIRKVPLQYEDGSTIDRYGVFWQEDAGKRINKEGVRFNKGGLVGK
jgi:hypothetical protein